MGNMGGMEEHKGMNETDDKEHSSEMMNMTSKRTTQMPDHSKMTKESHEAESNMTHDESKKSVIPHSVYK